MKLIEIFDQLTSSELSQLSIGDVATGMITEANAAKVIGHINLGLVALFKRFNLKEERLQLALIPYRTNYPLTYAFAVSNTRSKETDRFILDATNKFQSDLLRVESIVTDKGEPIPLNDTKNKYSILTPTMGTLRIPLDLANQVQGIPEEFKTSTLQVHYRASHPKIPTDDSIDPETYEVDLPYAYLEALLYFVASRVHNPIGMTQEFNSGNGYYARYEAACQLLENSGVKIDVNDANDRIIRNGWV